MKNFFKRVLSGALFVALTVGLIMINDWTFLAFVLVANFWLCYEFLRMSKNSTLSPNFFITIFTGTLAVLMVFLGCYFEVNPNFYWLILLLILCIFIEELFRNSKTPIQNISVSILSLVYITVPFVISILLVKGDMFYYQVESTFNPEVLIGVLILIWIFDSLAYCVGSLLGKSGKHKLFERISPKKSWEGEIGGALFTLTAGYFINLLFPVLTRTDWMIISGIVIVFGTFGDLIESMFKRSVNIKDSGDVLPGHGGLLDRLDSFIFTIPWVFFFLVIKEQVM